MKQIIHCVPEIDCSESSVSWESLQETHDVNVRICQTCQHKVYFCHKEAEIEEHVIQEHCIATDVQIPNRRAGRFIGKIKKPDVTS